MGVSPVVRRGPNLSLVFGRVSAFFVPPGCFAESLGCNGPIFESSLPAAAMLGPRFSRAKVIKLAWLEGSAAELWSL